ncbi:MAG: phage major capsid protein [Actinomycetota bacterium]|nr:phage major capsid protein [Actinomycetota bacterium]
MPGIQEEIKAEIEKQGTALHEFKAAYEKELAEIKASGTATAETAATAARANEAIQEIQNKIRDLETKANRPGNEADAKDPQVKANRAAFFNFVRGNGIAPEFRAALVEDTTGEILVPEDVEAGIRLVRGKLNVMRELSTVRTTTSNRIRRRSISEVVMGWGKLETGSALSESTPVPTAAYLYVEDMYGLVRVGEDELMDADENLAVTLEDSFGRATAEKEETGFVVGTGHANQQPEGFTLGTTVTRVNTAQNAAVTATDLITLAYGVSSSYRRNGAYLVNSQTELKMRLFKDTAGQFLWQPGLQAGTPASFNGFPVYNQEDLANVPAATFTADVAAFGDWKAGYLVVDRLTMTVKRLNELYATAGMVGFLAHFRVAGGVVDPAALRILRVIA